jgi:hypothetical protein
MNEDDRRRIRLHDLDRQAVRIDEALDIAPADAGLHPDQALRRLERQHPVHRAQIEVQAAGARGVAAHAEMPAAKRNRQRRPRQRILQLYRLLYGKI